MYLHCHNCNWSQDDFWEEDGYNPFSLSMDWLKERLFIDYIHMDKNYVSDMRGLGFDFETKEDTEKGYGYLIKGTDFVAMELMRKSRNIAKMTVKTFEEWKKVKDTFECPCCGSHDELDID
ncbi:MAG TPA: hypothetical protein VMV86_04995 [Methanosarcinales archaeon]|nr:hypothetical protein [Methanosarcinales archaeon]